MNDGRLVFVERYTAGNVARFLAILGGLYERAGYLGPVDLGVAVTGLHGALSSALASSHNPFTHPYPKPAFRRVRTVSAAELRNANRRVTMELVGRLIEASASPAFDPFATGGRG